MAATETSLVKELLRKGGTTYAQQAGIRLRGGSSSLFQLLCLSLLLSARIRSDTAVAAARALRDAGWRSAKAMAGATWEQRTRTLNGAGYARYDESTSRMLGATSELVVDRYRGDLRGLRDAADGDLGEMRRLLKECKGIGDVGADIFFREVQRIWPEVRPYFGSGALDTAAELGLPKDAQRLASLCSHQDVPRLAAALVRVGHQSPGARRELRERAA